jgi:hypothetical protein
MLELYLHSPYVIIPNYVSTRTNLPYLVSIEILDSVFAAVLFFGSNWLCNDVETLWIVLTGYIGYKLWAHSRKSDVLLLVILNVCCQEGRGTGSGMAGTVLQAENRSTVTTWPWCITAQRAGPWRAPVRPYHSIQRTLWGWERLVLSRVALTPPTAPAQGPTLCASLIWCGILVS